MGMFLQPDWWEVTKPGVGTNRYSYSAGDPVNMADRNGNKPSKADAKAMADDVYHKDGSKAAGRGLPEHISRMTAEERDKRFPGAVWSDERTGFLAGAYRNTRTGELSIAYAGTDPNSPADIATNVAYAATGDSMQHKQARELAKVASQATKNSADSLSFVGHSLGGGLALEATLSLGWSIRSINHHRTAVVFDPSGVSYNLGEMFSDFGAFSTGRNRNIDVHFVLGDPVAGGINVVIPGYGTPTGSLSGVYAPVSINALTNHSLDAFPF